MGRETTTWRAELLEKMTKAGECFVDIESTTLTDEQLDKPFYAGFGGEEGCPFTVWTKNRVYFPVCYDGAEWAGSVARHPDGIATEHIGGG